MSNNICSHPPISMAFIPLGCRYLSLLRRFDRCSRHPDTTVVWSWRFRFERSKQLSLVFLGLWSLSFLATFSFET